MQKDDTKKPVSAPPKQLAPPPLNYSKLITTFSPEVKFTSSLPVRPVATRSRQRVDNEDEEEIDWERDEFGPFYYNKYGDLIRP